MFIKNTTKKKIFERSFEGGYAITVLPGVSAIFDKAGQYLIDKYVPVGEHGKWRGMQFVPQAAPTPAIVLSSQKEWEKEGKRLAQIERFQIQPNLITKPGLLLLAEERGMKDQVNANMDEDSIIEILNAQPIPDEISYPHVEEKLNE